MRLAGVLDDQQVVLRGQISRIGSMSAICPYRCTGTIAVTGLPVRLLIARPSRVARALRLQVRAQLRRVHACRCARRRRRNPACAPACEIASVVAMNVFGTVTTVSPGFTPAAISANRSASVPLPTPTQCRAPQNSAKSRSNPSTIGPPMNPAVLHGAAGRPTPAPLRARGAA